MQQSSTFHSALCLMWHGPVKHYLAHSISFWWCAGAKKAFITAPSGPLNILKVYIWACLHTETSSAHCSALRVACCHVYHLLQLS